MYKDIYNICYFLVGLFFLLNIIQLIFFNDINLCDSNESINHFIIDNQSKSIDNEDKIGVASTVKPKFIGSIKDLIKRKIYWHVSVKDTLKYDSFTDFKKDSSWEPKQNLWNDIKSEWKSEWDLLKKGKLKESKFDIRENIRIKESLNRKV